MAVRGRIAIAVQGMANTFKGCPSYPPIAADRFFYVFIRILQTFLGFFRFWVGKRICKMPGKNISRKFVLRKFVTRSADSKQNQQDHFLIQCV